jgi:hypothetical protein
VLKVDITTPSGFDEFVEKVLCDNAPMVLTDLGAGSGKFTFKWFDDMHDQLQEAGVRFFAIGVVTSEVPTMETIFNWANARSDQLGSSGGSLYRKLEKRSTHPGRAELDRFTCRTPISKRPNAPESR